MIFCGPKKKQNKYSIVIGTVQSVLWIRSGFDGDPGKHPANLVQCVSGFSILGQCGSASESRCGFGSGSVYFTFLFLLIDNALYVALGLHEEHPSNKRSLKPSEENSQQNMIFVQFSNFLCVFFVLLHPDPDVIARGGFRYVGFS